MRGFLTRGGDVRVEGLHLSIGNALSRSNAGTVDYCEVGAKVVPKCGLPADAKRYRNIGVYYGGSSELSAALAEIPADAPLLKDATIDVSPVDQRGVSVIITDGLEVSGKGEVTPGERSAGCRPGPDSFCLHRVLANRAASGYGVWIQLVSLRFDGHVYPERGMSKEMYDAVNLYLEKLRTEPGPYQRIDDSKGMRITPSGIKGGDGRYRFEGVRPLLVVVLSRDIELGRRVSSALDQELRTAGVENPKGMLQAIELAPYGREVTSFDVGTIRVESPKVGAVDPVPGLRWQKSPHREKGIGLVGDLACEADGGGSITVTAKTARTAPVPLPLGLKSTERLTSVLPQQEYVQKTIKVIAAEGSRQQTVKVHCRELPPESVTSVVLEVSGGLDYSPPEPGRARGWWADWTAPDTFSRPHLVHRLADLVDAVLETNERLPTAQDRLTLRIKRLPARLEE